MGTDIRTGNMPTNISSNNRHSSSKLSGQGQATPPQPGQAKSADSVSMTDKVSHLQEIETRLAAIPSVNSAKVDQIKQAIADGSFKIDPSSIANKLMDMETSILDSDK